MTDVSIAESAPLHAFEKVVVLTGAGISRASGLPSYRGENGAWNDPEAFRAAQVETVASDLAAVWRVWGGLARTAAGVAPNPAHLALADADAALRSRRGELLVVTQNVDGLHQRAGQRDVVELHGTAHRQRCLAEDCAAVADFTGDGASVPRCAECGGPARPDIVLFGEQLDLVDLERSWAAATEADLLLAVGTSCEVSPAADLVTVAGNAGALCVALTRDPLTVNPGFQLTVTGLAETVLPAWVAASRDA